MLEAAGTDPDGWPTGVDTSEPAPVSATAAATVLTEVSTGLEPAELALAALASFLVYPLSMIFFSLASRLEGKGSIFTSGQRLGGNEVARGHPAQRVGGRGDVLCQDVIQIGQHGRDMDRNDAGDCIEVCQQVQRSIRKSAKPSYSPVTTVVSYP